MVKVQFYTLDDLIKELTGDNITTVRAEKVRRDVPLFYTGSDGKKGEVMYTQAVVVISGLRDERIKFYEEVAGMLSTIELTHSKQKAGELEERVNTRYEEIKKELGENKFEVKKGIYVE